MTREPLPNRRCCRTLTFTVGNLKYTATVGYYDDGRVGEIFLSNTRPSSQSDTYARDAAVAASLALQHGCALETLRHAVLRNADGTAAMPLGAALDTIVENSPASPPSAA